MDKFDEYMSQAERLGLKGEEVKQYVKECQDRVRDERALQRAERQKDQEIEKEEKEREEREKEKEREFRLREKEREEREKEREFRLRELELENERELRKIEATSKARHGPQEGNQPRSEHKYIPRLPPFDENKDDIDSFLFRFESHAAACGWPEEQWTLYIASLFKGSALALYHSFAAAENLTWDQLKEELLKKFQCSTEGFRTKFRSVRPEKHESFPSFFIRSAHYLDRWIELSQTDKDYKSLRNLLLREQLLQSVSKDLAVFLQERDFKTAEEMCKAADLYKIAHPEKPVSRRDTTVVFEANVGAEFQHSQGSQHSQKGNFQNSYSSRGANRRNFRQGQKHSGRGYAMEQSEMFGQRNPRFTHRPPRRGNTQHNEPSRGGYGRGAPQAQTKSQEPRCFHCGGLFHFKKDCAYLSVESANVSSAVQDTEVTYVLSQQQTVEGLVVEQGSVNGFQATVLRDTGCTTAGVRKDLVLPHQYLDKVQKCRTFGGKIESFPIANISVVTPYYTGSVQACVIDSPVCDLILGNIQGVSTVHGGSGGSFVPCLVTTRAEAEKEGKSQKPLKVPDLAIVDLSPKEIAAMQKQDKTLQHLFPAGNRQEQDQSKPYYFVEAEVLYRKVKQGDSEIHQVVVPEGLRGTVLHIAHDALLAGHCGVKRTLQRVLKSFYWPGVANTVTQYCRSCDLCQKTVPKGRIPCAPLHKMPLICTPYERVAIDLVGPFQPSSSGHRFVLTIVDTATRFPEAIPLKKIDTVSVAEALLSVFSRVGLPREILSDCGTQFVSNLMQEVYRLLSVKPVTTTPYHPQSNGMVERFNGTLKTMLRKVSREEPREWDRYIPALLFAYRELPNETLGFSPFELMYGHSPRGPIGLLAEKWTGKETEEEAQNVYQYVTDLKDRILTTCKLAQESADKKTDTYKYFADRKAKPRTLRAGDKVLVLLTEEHNKLRVLWKGPFTVKEVISAVNYRIDMKGTCKVFHINMLKQYVERVNVAINESISLTDAVVDKHAPGSDVSDILPVNYVPDVVQKQDRQTEQPAQSETVQSDCESSCQGPQPVACVGLVTNTDTDESRQLPTLSVLGETYKDVKISEDLTDAQTRQIQDVLKDFQDVLTDKPGSAVGVEPHSVHLTTDVPVRVKPYPLPFAKKEVIEKEVNVMLNLGVIEASVSPYSAPVVLVKKPDGSVRFCIDYRELNKVTVFDAEPIPDIEELLCHLSEGKFFVKIDLAKGYWQIPMLEKDKETTAFQTPFGLFHWKWMPFGLQTAPATFARVMRTLKLHECGAVSFFDDILLSQATWGALLENLRRIFDKLRSFGLTARPSKVSAGFQTLEFLGHTITVGKMMPEEGKVKKILSIQQPKSKKQVRSVLGLLSYYRRYVPHFAGVTAPLTNLTKGTQGRQIQWTPECQEALEKVQKTLNTFPVLLLPCLGEDFVLRTDASSQGMGAVLLQQKGELLHPVQYASKKFTETQKKYSTIERECLAVVWGCEKFARFLAGRQFILQTDHRPLTFLRTAKTKNSRLLRWALALQEFAFQVEPLPGRANIFADLLSRD